jgi:hypothetical protein
MTRTEHVAVHVSKARKKRLEQEAAAAELSTSAYVNSILDEHWADADADEAADRMDAEEKIERVTNQALREIEDAARHTEQRVDALADMVARSGSYSIANFESLKHQYGPPEGTKTDALRVGSRRLRAPLSDHPDLLDGDGDSDDSGDASQDEADPLTVEDAENADNDDDTEEEDLSASERFFKGRGRSKEEAEKTRW